MAEPSSQEKPVRTRRRVLYRHLQVDVPLHMVAGVGVYYYIVGSLSKFHLSAVLESAFVALIVVLVRELMAFCNRMVSGANAFRTFVSGVREDISREQHRRGAELDRVLQDIERLRIGIFKQIQSIGCLPLVASGTPFLGSFGRLWFRSGGSGTLEAVDEREYLDLLRKTASESQSYCTIHKDRLSWFREHDPDGQYLCATRDVDTTIRLLLVDSDDYEEFYRDIYSEESRGLRNWYWSRVGNTATYWTTLDTLRRLQAEWPKTHQEQAVGSVDDIRKDVVICNGQLFMSYDDQLRELSYEFEKRAPYQWVFDALREQIGSATMPIRRSGAPKPDPDSGLWFVEVPRTSEFESTVGSSREEYAVVIDLDSIVHNARKIRSNLQPGKQILAVLKNNAYGQGLRQIARHLEDCNSRSEKLIDWFGVGTVAEARVLLGEYIVTPILVLDGILSYEAADVVRNKWVPVVWEKHIVRALAKAAADRNTTADIHVKINTGLNRLGVNDDEFRELMECIKTQSPHVRMMGICSHLGHNPDQADRQVRRFLEMVQLSEEILPGSTKLTHIHSSMELHEFLMGGDQSEQISMARIGGALLGVPPEGADKLHQELGLRPAVSVRSEVIQVRELLRGANISYTCEPFGRDHGQVAIVRIGYADGFPSARAIESAEAHVLIKGVRCPILGEVYMGLLTVDVTGVPGVGTGDAVTVIGTDGETITVGQFAKAFGLKRYEVLSRFGQSMPHKYTGQSRSALM